jgi:uncharacterized membrane protein YdbT with pleckstrin-like domain
MMSHNLSANTDTSIERQPVRTYAKLKQLQINRQKIRNHPARESFMSDDTKICPVCAETIKAAAIKCRFCNTDLSAFESAREATAEKPLFSGRPAVVHSVWQWGIVIITLGIAYIFYWLATLSTHYEITTQRIRIERGLLSKTKDSIELFRIDHFDLHKPLGMRLLGFCLLHLRSTDTNFPSVMLYGIPELESLADTLRECGLRERARRRVTTFVEA